MADGKVNITFATVAQLGGLNALSAGVKNGSREFKDFGEAGSKVISALEARFRNGLTVAVGESFSIIKDLARGGVWGALAAVAGKAIDFVCSKMKETEERMERMARMRSSRAHRLAQSIASYAELAARKEREAYEARAKAMKEYAKAQTDMVNAVERNNAALASAEQRLSAARRRRDVANGESDELIVGNQERARGAQNAVDAAKTALWAVTRKLEVGAASAMDVEIAEKNLAAATAELAAVEAENAKRMRDREAEEAKRAAEAEHAAGADLARQEAAFRADQLRDEEKRQRERLSVIDRALAAQKKLAAAWEEAARKARGKDFAVWLGETEAEEKAARDERRRFDRANAGAARRAQSIRNRGFWAKARDKSWLARYDEWKAAQDPANNSAAKEAEKLEKERAAKVAEIADVVKALSQALKDANTQG